MSRQPRQARAIATVNAIVDAGFICLRRHGLIGTTTNHIAEIAGISTGSLYEYFPNKEAIYAAMSDRFQQDIASLILDRSDTLLHLELDDLISTMARDFSDLLQRDDQRYLHLIRLILLLDSHDFLEKLSQRLADFIVRYLIHHPDYLRIRHLHTAVYILINAGIFSILRFHSADKPTMSYDELIDGLTRMVKFYVLQDLAEREQQECSVAQ